MRYLLMIVAICTLFIGGIGYAIHESRQSAAERGAKDLRPYVARVDRIEYYRCKGSCHRLIVSYYADGRQRSSKLGARPLLVGQTLTVWAKPDYEYAYISPEAYMGVAAPRWFPASLLLLPLLAILGAVASTRLEAWRRS